MSGHGKQRKVEKMSQIPGDRNTYIVGVDNVGLGEGYVGLYSLRYLL